MQNFNQAIQRFRPLFKPPVQPSIRPMIQPTAQPPVQPPVQPIRPTIMPTTAPTETPLITPKDSSIARIQNVFGEGWQPSAAFTPELQGRGIYGAVRVENTDDVYTIGPGGSKETPVSYQEKFGTLAQEDIVGIVTPEQATRLGIATPSTPVAPMEKAAAEIETEELPEELPEELLPEPEAGEVEEAEEAGEAKEMPDEEITRIIENPQSPAEIGLGKMFIEIAKDLPKEIAKTMIKKFIADLAKDSITKLFKKYFTEPKKTTDCRKIHNEITGLYAKASKKKKMNILPEDKGTYDMLLSESMSMGCPSGCDWCKGKKKEEAIDKELKKSYKDELLGMKNYVRKLFSGE